LGSGELEMIKEYICNFSGNKQLVFKITPSEVSELWSNLIELNLQKNSVVPFIYNDLEFIDYKNVQRQIKQSCMILNLSYNDDTFTLQGINDLETIIYQAKDNKSSFFYSDYINAHQLEILVQKFKRQYFKTKLVSWNLKNYNTHTKITRELRPHWCTTTRIVHPPHSLFLGYNATGPSLYDAFLDNNIDPIINNKIDQPKFITTQVIYSPQKRILQGHELFEIKKWLKTNKCIDRVNLLAPEFNYNTNPVLGKLKTKLSDQEILDIWKNYNFLNVSIN